MVEEWTPEEADAELRMSGPEDLYYAVKHARMHDVDPVWRAALARATARERRQTERVLAAVGAGGEDRISGASGAVQSSAASGR